MVLKELRDKVNDLVKYWMEDPEGSHGDEAELLYAFIRWVGMKKNQHNPDVPKMARILNKLGKSDLPRL